MSMTWVYYVVGLRGLGFRAKGLHSKTISFAGTAGASQVLPLKTSWKSAKIWDAHVHCPLVKNNTIVYESV